MCIIDLCLGFLWLWSSIEGTGSPYQKHSVTLCFNVNVNIDFLLQTHSNLKNFSKIWNSTSRHLISNIQYPRATRMGIAWHINRQMFKSIHLLLPVHYEFKWWSSRESFCRQEISIFLQWTRINAICLHRVRIGLGKKTDRQTSPDLTGSKITLKSKRAWSCIPRWKVRDYQHLVLFKTLCIYSPIAYRGSFVFQESHTKRLSNSTSSSSDDGYSTFDNHFVNDSISVKRTYKTYKATVFRLVQVFSCWTSI